MRTSTRRVGCALALLAGVGLLTACGTSSEPTTKPMTDVAVGDCFDADEAFTTAFVYADCTPPHLYEAFWAEDVTGDEFPGDEAIATRAGAVCDAQFVTFSGTPVGSGASYASLFLGPTSETWAAGDRSIVCVAMPLDGQPKGDSAKAS